MTQQDRATFESYLDAGDYKDAEAAASQAAQLTPDGRTTNVVWSLNAGAAMFDAGDMQRAVAVLDNTEKLAQANDLHAVHAAMDYRYTTYDGVMTNIYKAMAFVAVGDQNDARTEFLRADDRQRRAEEHFQREIARAAAAGSGGQDPNYADMMQKAERSPEYANAVANLSRLAVYAPFENPFATYLSGVYFLAEGDYAKGMDRLKRASQMLGPDSPAEADVEWAERGHRARELAPQVWVVFENGQSATYHEMRLVLPTLAGTPMTLALPVLAQNAPAYPSVSVQAGGVSATTAPAGSFDAVMASEFRRRQNLIVAEAVAEVLAKNVGAMVAQKSNNALMKLAMGVVANVSTADTRSWTALPKEFQATRVAAPADGHVVIAAPDGAKLGDAVVPAGKSSIVWVKTQREGAHPAIEVFPL